MNIEIPARLARLCQDTPERRAWLAALPATIAAHAKRWSLRLEAPFDTPEVSCAWVAPAWKAGGDPAVLKVGLPHFESDHEAAGLRFWDGGGAVRILESADEAGVLLVERCQPGTHLRLLPEDDQDVVVAGLLRRLWRPGPVAPFRPLSALTSLWSAETERQSAQWPDTGLVRAGLQLLRDLPESAPDRVVLATDLHAGNVLRAQREPWLVIDPKPFVGDPAYDATQHLLNCRTRLARDSTAVIGRFADLLEVDADRVRLWTFARLAADPREDWQDGAFELARRLS